MHTIRHEIELSARADRVWDVVGDPGAIATWVPALATSRLEGDLRHATLPDGSASVERIVHRSDVERTYSYEIVEAPLTLDGYLSTLAVDDLGDRSRVVWTARFEADADLRDAVSGMYVDGLAGLAQHLSNPSTAKD